MKDSLLRRRTYFYYVLVMLLFALTWLPFQALGEEPKFADGNGTEANPYSIATADQLNYVRNYLDAHFQLIADIDLGEAPYNEGVGWTPIGSTSDPFKGTFDGNGHKIKNLTINDTEASVVGLFGAINSDAVIKNIGLVDVNIEGKSTIGGLVGESNGHITNAYVTGTITAEPSVTYSFSGGLVGITYQGSITDSFAEVNVSGRNYVGGLVGKNEGATITNSYAIGNVSSGTYVGGLVGSNEGASITNSYATGDVSGSSNVGGLVGSNQGATITYSYATGTVSGNGSNIGGLAGYNSHVITDSYATGDVNGYERVGGLVGGLNSGSVTNSYATGAVSAVRFRGGLIGSPTGPTWKVTNSYYKDTTGRSDNIGRGEPKSTEEMKRLSTFVNWDFETVWYIWENEEYPSLRWQGWDDHSDFSASLEQAGSKAFEETFNLSITNAKGIFDNVLTDDIHVTVTSDKSEEVFNGTVTFVDGDVTVPVTLNAVGVHNLTIQLEGVTASKSVTVEVVAVLEDIKVATPPNKTKYFVGDSLDLAGLEVTGFYSDNSSEVLTITMDHISGFDSSAPAKDQVITVTYEGKTTTFTVDIIEPVLERIEITSSPDKTEYFVGEALDLAGLEVTGYYTDNSSEVLTITMDHISGFDSSAPAKDQVITVTYEGKTTTFTVNIIEPVLERIEITSLPTKTEYFVGESLDLASLVVTGYYTDNSSEVLTITMEHISGFDSSAPAKDQVITVTYEGKTTTFTVNIIEPVLERIEITSLPTKTEYFVGESLDLASLVVTGYYTDNSSEVLTITMDHISGFDSSAPAKDQVITVTYEGKTTTFTVDIIEPVLERIEITSSPDKTEYFVGEALDLAGLEVTGYYTDNSSEVLTITMDHISGFDSSAPAKDQVITVTYEGKTTTFTVDIIEPVLERIEITSSPDKTEYFVGEALDLAGLEVTGYYTDNSSKALTITMDHMNGFDSTVPTVNQVITVNYEGKTTTFTVTITIEPDTEAPTVPANFRSTSKTATSISLAWDEATDNIGVSHYELEMKQGTGSWQQVAEPTGTAYIQTGLVASTSYTFRVRSVDEAGNRSAWSEELSIHTDHVGGGGGGNSDSTERNNNGKNSKSLFIDVNNKSLISPSDMDTSKRSVTLQVEATDSGSAYVSVPASIMTELANENRDFLMEIESPYANYLLPVTLPSLISGWEELLEENDSQAEEISFKLSLTDKTEDSHIREVLSVQLPSGKLIGSIVDVHLEIVDAKTGEVLTEVNQFTEPIIRMIPISGELTEKSNAWGAFRYDETSEKFVFVPARLEQRGEHLYAVIRSNSNSIYVALSNAVSFSDMEQHWGKVDVEQVAAKGLVYGIGDGKFTPDKVVTRAEFAAMLVRAIGPVANSVSYAPTYKDVQPKAWYYNEVAQAEALGLLDFIEGDRLLPNEPLSREEMASMVAKAVRLEKQSLSEKSVSLDRYRDHANMDEAYLEDIEVIVALGIMNGTRVDQFSPKGESTRAQAAVVLLRTLRMLDWID